jgi:hypothetical protein
LQQVTVRCTVDNCYYWRGGNVCDAKEILVTNDMVGQRYPGEVDVQHLSTVLEEVGETPVKSCQETCCKTFRPGK